MRYENLKIEEKFGTKEKRDFNKMKITIESV